MDLNQNDEEFTIPYVSPELVEFLKRHFCFKSPTEQTSDRRIWMDVGNQEVVDWLYNRSQFQNKE